MNVSRSTLALAGTLWAASIQAAAPDAAARTLRSGLEALWAGELGPAPATPGLLLLEMARESSLAERVLARAGAPQRALTDTLLSTLALSEAEAVRLLPALYVVRDDSPPADQRPPSWAQWRWQGVELAERIALDPANGRDLRLQRALAERRQQVARWTPSEIAGLVVLFSQWWVDRGDDPQFYLAPAQVPSVESWLTELSGERTLWQILPALHDDPLRRRMLTARLTPTTHAYLSGECMEILGSYAEDFAARGFAARRWDANSGRMVGYDEIDLRAVALELLPQISPTIPSGTDEHEQIRDAFRWWRAARYQARYYRDAKQGAPLVLPRALTDLRPATAGGLPMADWLKALYSHDELRPLILDEVDSHHAPFVAELMQWLGYSLEQAREAGFNFAERRYPLRPDPSSKGQMYVVPWPSVQYLIRELLGAITGHELIGGPDLDPDNAQAQWQAWWNGARSDPRWYRDPADLPTGQPRFQPQRGRDEG